MGNAVTKVHHTARPVNVFLGGSCNPTTWRKDIAMPYFDKHGITYYNPQVDEWHDGLMELENRAKETATILLFVVDDLTRGYASIAEAAYYIGAGRKVVLVIHKVTDPGPVIGESEIKDINRGRIYLNDIASQNKTPVFKTVLEAAKHIAGMIKA